MTTPPPGGGTGMNYGDDYVSARLSIDIPEGATQGLREITQEVNNFRTAMELAVHAESDITRYLNDMAEASERAASAQQNLIQQLQTYLAMSGRAMQTPGGMGGVPYGNFQQPFTGMYAGTGMVPGQAIGAQRPFNPSDEAYRMLSRPGTGDPGAYLNMQHQRGAVTAQDMVSLSPETINDVANRIAERQQQMAVQEEITDKNPRTAIPGESGPGTESMMQRISRAAGLAGQVINEMGPGGTVAGTAGLGVRGLQWAARKYGTKRRPPTAEGPKPPGDTSAEAEQEGGGDEAERPSSEAPHKMDTEEAPESGILGKLKSMLGPLAIVATTAAAGFGVYKAGGHMIQGARNIGSIRGGAAGEGAQVEFKARYLSMSPFITQEQARQIYQSVMSEGYADASGAGADNVIDFMKHNLTSMNISVAESTKMLRGNIVGQGKGDKDSVAGAVAMLGTELDNIRTLSRQGVMSQPDYRQHVMNLQEQLINQGVSPEAAAQQAQIGTQVGSEDQRLKGQFAETEGAMIGSPRGAMMMAMMGGAKMPGGLSPLAYGMYMGQHGEAGQASENTLRSIAQRMYNTYERNNPNPEVGHDNAVVYFQAWVRSMFPNSPIGQSTANARNWYEKLMGNQGSDVASATRDVNALTPMPSGGENPGAGSNDQISIAPTSGQTGPAAPQAPPAASSRPAPAAAAQSTTTTKYVFDLSPNAQKLLNLLGPTPAQLTTAQQGANRGMDGYATNSQHVGPV